MNECNCTITDNSETDSLTKINENNDSQKWVINRSDDAYIYICTKSDQNKSFESPTYIRHLATQNSVNKREEVENRLSTTNIIIGVVCISIFLIILGILFGIFWCMCKQRIKQCCNQRRQRQFRELRNQEIKRRKHDKIAQVMGKMRNGPMATIYTPFKNDECIICLEEFTDDSKVHITNECSHVFHSICLFKWYESVALHKMLRCPHCNTCNTSSSAPSPDVVHLNDIEVAATPRPSPIQTNQHHMESESSDRPISSQSPQTPYRSNEEASNFSHHGLY